MSSEIDILSLIMHSGPVVKLVLFILIFSSILSWAIIIQKKKMFNSLKKSNREFLAYYEKSSKLNDILDRANKSSSPFAIMYSSGYTELLKLMDKYEKKDISKYLSHHFSHYGMGILERGLRKGVNVVNEKLDKLLSLLASIGSITPFIGLFGTIWGIIHSFQGLSEGAASLEVVAPGIAEALVATGIGLFAAIPAVWFYNHFISESQKLNSQMETFGQDFLNLIERSITKKS